MNIGLIEEFSRIGGGQKFAQIVSEMLTDEGFKVTLITDRDHNFVQGKYHKIIETNFRYSEGMTSLSVLIRAISLRRELKRFREFEFTINNHPNVFLFKGDVNSLHSISISEQAINEEGKAENRLLLSALKALGLYKIYEGGLFWAPTEYNRNISQKIFDILDVRNTKFFVLPIPITRFPEINLNEKKDQILVFGRISREKRLDLALELAKELPMKFIIAGAVNPGNEGYYRSLLSLAPENVTFIANPSEEMKDELFRDSKIFLHFRKRENFPISVLEAIAYGCIPVVPRSGGTWTDIVQRGEYGFGYSDISEAIQCITKARNLNQDKSRHILDSRNRFSFQNFRRGYIEMIENTMTGKRK